MQLIESIYLLLDGFYSDSLRNYLSGYDCASASFAGVNIYSTLGVHTAIITAVVCVLYYKLLDPTSGKIFKWLMSMLVAMLTTASWAYYTVSSAENKGLIGECLLRDDEGNTLISSVDFLGLGVSNAIITLVLFFALSLLVRFWSTNNRYIPF